MNYSDLVNTAKSYADRQDIEVSNNIDTFILMAEARINRLLKTRKQSKRASTPTVKDAEYYALPPDYAGMRDIQLNSDLPSNEHSVQSMTYAAPIEFNKFSEGETQGFYYTIIANQIQVFPKTSAGQSIELTYYQKVPALNSSSEENWLSEDHPDIYLSGLTAEIELFAKNYDVAKAWDDRMTRAINELGTSDTEERWAGGPLVVRAI